MSERTHVHSTRLPPTDTVYVPNVLLLRLIEVRLESHVRFMGGNKPGWCPNKHGGMAR